MQAIREYPHSHKLTIDYYQYPSLQYKGTPPKTSHTGDFKLLKKAHTAARKHKS